MAGRQRQGTQRTKIAPHARRENEECRRDRNQHVPEQVQPERGFEDEGPPDEYSRRQGHYLRELPDRACACRDASPPVSGPRGPQLPDRAYACSDAARHGCCHCITCFEFGVSELDVGKRIRAANRQNCLTGWGPCHRVASSSRVGGTPKRPWAFSQATVATGSTHGD